MNVLVLCDDHWHPAHVVRAGLELLSGDDLTFDVIEDAGAFDRDALASQRVVLLAKSDNTSATDRTSWCDTATQAAFADYVNNGGGLLVVHSGTASLRNLPTLRRLVGGAFTHHPPRCPVTVEPIKGHPLTEGAMTFTAEDEHYMMELDDPTADVFLTSHSEHGEQPAGWTRRPGDGRVCVLTPGHTVEVWTHPSFQALLHNALGWCSGRAL